MASVKEAEQLTARSKTLSQRVASYNQRVVAEGDALAEEVSMLQKAIAKATRAAQDGQVPHEDAGRIQDELWVAQMVLRGHGPGGDLRKLLKQRNPWLLQLLLGAKTNVITVRRNQSIALKEEYHAFRDRVAMLLVVLAGLLSTGLAYSQSRAEKSARFTLTPPFMVGVQVYLCWVLYSYTAMALRENVLKVNGSSIRPWWIHHHYWSILTCLILLTLPVDSPAVQVFVKKFLWWSGFQGLVMILQNRYQRRRMYTRIALGKNSAMDVVSGESSGGQGQLLILYPLLLALQLSQMFIGAEMMWITYRSLLSTEGFLDMEAHESDLRGSRGVFMAGSLTLFMGVCNMKNTFATLLVKRRAKQRARRRSRGEGGRTGSTGLPIAPGADVAASSTPAGKGQQAAAANDIAAGNSKAGKAS